VKRYYTPHVSVVKAQTLDEAVDIIARKQRLDKQKRAMTGAPATAKQRLRNERLGLMGRAMRTPISLSDRIVPARMDKVIANMKARAAKPDVVWTREQCIAAYDSGYFNVNDLRLRAKVSALQIFVWTRQPEWVPSEWRCTTCSELTRPTPGTQDDPTCTKCKQPWRTSI
jgi:hypothetical protein